MTLTASVSLDRVFINLASDFSQVVIAGSSGAVGGGSQRADQTTREGEFRQYANGRVRLITGTGNTRVLSIALRALSPDQVELLYSFLNKTVLLRDTYGRRMWGSFTVATRSDIPLSGDAGTTLKTDVGINFQEIYYDETV